MVMHTEKNYVVFQCYGNEDIFFECANALLSLSKIWRDKQQADIWIYTDKLGWFDRFVNCPLQLNYRTLNNETLSQWRGTIDFVHRVKIEVLRDFAQQRTGNILYLDTDVVFLQDTEDIWKNLSAGALYMHVLEGRVSDRINPIMAKLDSYLRTKPALKIHNAPMYELDMWNAGVLGFNTKYKQVLDEVLLFTDQHYPEFQKHVMEQFAFSVFFRREGKIKAAAPYILHYWNLKEARTILRPFFTEFKNSSWQQLCHYSNMLQMPVLMQEKINFYENRSLMDKLLKKRWHPAVPRWTALLEQL
jgi:hypothetical protein